jgi:hypothetical protein
MVFALAGDSTMTNDLATLPDSYSTQAVQLNRKARKGRKEGPTVSSPGSLCGLCELGGKMFGLKAEW